MNLKRITLDDTVEETVNKINENSTDIEENVSRLEAEFIPYKDNITLKISKIEKELNDYKATMQQVNINQEPKQKATGYGTVSLPKNAANGQVSVSVKGRTYRQELIYNRETWVEWTKPNVGKGIVFNDGEVNTVLLPMNNPKPNNKYGLLIYKKDTLPLNLLSYYYGLFLPNCELFGGEITNPGWYKAILTSRADIENFQKFGFYNANKLANEITDVMLYDLSDAELLNDFTNLTASQLAQKYPYVSGTKSTISAFRIRSVSEDESQESVVYVLAKDDEGNIEELRSLPNGVKDEIRFNESTGKYECRKRTGTYGNVENITNWIKAGDFTNHVIFTKPLGSLIPNILIPPNDSTKPNAILIPSNKDLGKCYSANFLWTNNIEGYTINSANALQIRVEKSKLTTLDSAGFETWLKTHGQIMLIYQLATPIEKPIQVSGSLVSYPSGTVYIEPFVADAGIYTDKMSVLHQDLPIKAIEKLSKVDFITGLETELDVSETVIAGDKLSFTHPDLEAGDIVFFVYEYDRESTVDETEIEYYDSRYTIKDSVTDKFYKWNVTVADGVPSIELVEV